LVQSGEAQYAISNIFEHRLTYKTVNFPQHLEDLLVADQNFNSLWTRTNDSRKTSLTKYIEHFLNYLISNQIGFNFDDCSIGNLIYAGAYLAHGSNFQAANAKLCDLIGVNAKIVSISNEGTHLIGLLEDGTVLKDEASIVSLQSASQIRNLFLMPSDFMDDNLGENHKLSIDEIENMLKAMERIPNATEEALLELNNADLIIYGAGTQHSSLFPTYKVLAHSGWRPTSDVRKILIANLDWDADIQNWNLHLLVTKFQDYWGDAGSMNDLLTDVLVDNTSRLGIDLPTDSKFSDINISCHDLRNRQRNNVHSGYALYKAIRDTLQINMGTATNEDAMLVISLQNSQSVREQSIRVETSELFWPGNLELEFKYSENKVVEKTLISEIQDWLETSDTRYFIGVTGHGAYSLGDLANALNVIAKSNKAVLSGNRFETRSSWVEARRTSFEERKLNQLIATLGGAAVDLIINLKFKKSVADPFSRAIVIDRGNLPTAMKNLTKSSCTSLLQFYALLWENNVPTGEFEIKFRAFSGESAGVRAIARGLRDLWRILWI